MQTTGAALVSVLLVLVGTSLGIVALLVGAAHPAALARAPTPAVAVSYFTPTTVPAIPTATARPPVATPRLSPDVVATLTALDRQAYADYVGPRMATAGRALGALASQLRAANENPSLAINIPWRLNTAAALATLRSVGQDLQAYRNVPPELTDTHVTVAEIGRETVALADDLTTGLDNADAAYITRAAERMQRINALAGSGQTALRQHGILY